jgi:hypothetical protein
MFQGYSGMLFFVLLAYTFSLRGLQTSRKLLWWLAGACWMMAVYSHLYSALAVFGIFGLILIWHLSRRGSERPWLQIFKTPITATATGILIGVIAAMGPPLMRWLLHSWLGILPHPGVIYTPQRPDRVLSIVGLIRDFTSFNDDNVWHPLPFYVVLSMAILAIWLAVIRRKFAPVAITLGAILLPYGAYQVINWFRPDILGRERYFLYTLPFFLLLVAHFPPAITAIVKLWHRLDLPLQWLINAGVLVLIVILWLPLLSTFYATGLSGNWRPVAMYLAERIQATDLVLCEPLRPGWEEQYLARAKVCQENLDFWWRTRGLTRLYPVLPLAIAADYSTLSLDPRILGRYTNSWLVLTDVSHDLAAQDATGASYPEWHEHGRTLVIPSPPDSRIYDSLVFFLNLLRTWSPDASSELFYSARLAQMASIGGDLAGAREMWRHVEQLRPYVPRAEAEVLKSYDALQRDPLLKLPEHQMAVQMGDAIRFEGYTLYSDTMIKPGDTLRLTLFWRALQRPSADYTTFIHVTDHQGRIIFQEDFMPTPHTTGWWPGDFVWNERLFTVPESVPPGEYQIITGMYLLATMDRLPVTGESVRDGSIVLATLRVE